MPNAKNASATPTHHKILVVGAAGAGKSTQTWSLPGKKFAYFFDPNALLSVQGLDIDYEEFLPDALELDATLKSFNKNSKPDDKPTSARIPTVYMNWVEDLNKKHEAGFFKNYDWLVIDSLTLLSSAVMDRQMYLNNRFGGTEDIADYRIVGTKIADVFRSICSIPINLYCTGHINSFQDEKTKRIEQQLNLPGKSRRMLPLLFSNIWELRATQDEKASYVILTRPEPRGFQEIRTTIRGLPPIVDATIKDFAKAENYGIGSLLGKHEAQIATLARSRELNAARDARIAESAATSSQASKSR